jgi:diguanylate cyclase
MIIKTPKLNSNDKHKSDKNLSNVIVHSESIKDMVQICAEDLSSVNTVLKKDKSAQPLIKKAIKKNTTVEIKVQLAVDELDIVNIALKDEVKERKVIEQDLEDVVVEKDLVTAQLNIANEALKDEVKDREVIEKKLLEVNVEKDLATQASLHDTLTGLPNRALFYDRLEHGLEQAKRHDWNLAVMFIDLNKFKKINDEYGHDIGDTVLLTIAKRLKENTRSDDTVCRFGGDEFLYLLMEVKSELEVIKILKKLIKTLELPCDDTGLNLIVKSSIGVSLFPKNADNSKDLVKFADEAMYAAKKNKLGYVFA